jgi:hypothetical protein
MRRTPVITATAGRPWPELDFPTLKISGCRTGRFEISNSDLKLRCRNNLNP